jgi:tetratricopeptide (TPR) repeat protein
MDNYEHMLDGTAIVSDILQAAPGVTVLATSRERLNLTEEQLFPLGGMDFPDWGMPEDTLGYAAVKLFMHSAKRIRPDFDLAADDLPYLARICHLVAGMPLAIVLAATWVEMLSLREIAEEITEGLEVLESELRDIPERQRSIQAVFEYSWQQLDEKERHVFAKASVFRGGMTRKAAQAVTGAKLRTLQSLLNKGLLRRDPDIGRFHIHELLRQYAEVRLEEKGEVAITQDAHMDYYADALQGRLMDLRGHRQLQALDDIASDFENVGAAWHWALKQKHYDVIGRMVEVVARFGDLRTRWQDIEPLITKAIEQLAAEPHNVHQAFLGRLLIHQGWAFIYVGDYSTAQAVVCRGQELVEHNHDQGGIAFARISLGMILLNQGKWERAGGRFHQGLNIYRSTGDQHGIARCLNGLGAVALRQAQYEQAEDYLQQSLVIYRAMGDQHGMANCLGNLSFLSRQQGQPERAEGYLQQCLTIMRAIGNQRGIGTSLNSLGALAWFQQKYERAEEYFLQCYAIYLAIGEQRAIGQSLNNLGMVADARGDVTAAQDYYEQSIACKRKIGLRHDLAYTLVELGILQARQADPAATETLREALNIASELEVTRLMLWALAGIAQLCASNENLIRAVELASLAQSQSSGDSELQDRLRPLEDDLRAKLGKETYNAAWERGRQLDLETVVQELLEEFGEK